MSREGRSRNSSTKPNARRSSSSSRDPAYEPFETDTTSTTPIEEGAGTVPSSSSRNGGSGGGRYSQERRDQSQEPPVLQQPAPAYGKAATMDNYAYNATATHNNVRRAVKEGPSALEPVVLHTDDWPFGGEQEDAAREKLLGRDDNALHGRTEVPQLKPDSFKQLRLSGDGVVADHLKRFDVDCAKKHLDAIAEGIVTDEDQLNYVLMSGETEVDSLDVCGIVNAPGLFHELTQRCRLTFTSKNRLIFTQAKHMAQVGVPKLHCLSALLQLCLQDTSSTRRFTSYYGAINASDVLHVFVQQILTTRYRAGKCDCADPSDLFCCTVGGMLNSEKDVDKATMTLGDYDQESLLCKRWDKERYMRHTLVIRYLNSVNNEVAETIAYAHPQESPAKLYQMARAIEACKTITARDWLGAKNVPRGAFGAFLNESVPPLLRKGSYKILLVVLFVFTFGFFFLNTSAAVIMLLGLFVMLGGAYAQLARHANLFMGSPINSKLMLSQGGGASVYAIGFLLAVTGYIRKG